MKLDVDLSDPKSLRRAEGDLVNMLDIVRHALAKHQSRTLIQLPEASANGESYKKGKKLVVVQSLIDKMPKEFTTVQFVEAVRAIHPNISSGTVKDALKRATESKLLNFEKGKGHKQNTYQRTNHH